LGDTRARVLGPLGGTTAAAEVAAPRAMLFTDFDGRLSAVRLELVQRIETAPVTAIDRSRSRPRVVIDGMILPLIGLPDEALAVPHVRLLRLSDGTCELLYAVREVEDAVELKAALHPVPEEPLAEAVTLIGGRPVTLIDAHALFAAFGEPPLAAVRPRCTLPQDDWARTILAPLVSAAGYDIVPLESADAETVVMVFEEVFEVTEALGRSLPGPVILLRDQPENPHGGTTIYRYDREGLLAALAAARTLQVAGGCA